MMKPMQIMLSAGQQKNVWDGWLSAEIRANYFADMCIRYHRTQRAVTWFTLLASSGAVAAILRNADQSWQLTLMLAAAALSLWSTVHNYSKGGTDCGDLHFRWNKLGQEYEDLWNDMYQPDSQAKLSALRSKEAELSKSSNAFPTRERLMLKWQDHVMSHHAGQAPA